MKRLFIIGLVLFIVFSNSCVTTNCPDDIKIGEKFLTSKSLSFFPYLNKQKLIFEDSLGERLIFSSPDGVKKELNKIHVYKKCTEFKYDGQSSYEYFEGESRNVVFFSKDPEYSFNLGLFTSILRPEQEMFYDHLIVDLTGIGTIGRGDFVTDIRFTETYKEEEFNITNKLTFVGDLIINDSLYKEVYKSDYMDSRQIYFSRYSGLVGFKHGSKSYNLVSILND